MQVFIRKFLGHYYIVCRTMELSARASCYGGQTNKIYKGHLVFGKCLKIISLVVNVSAVQFSPTKIIVIQVSHRGFQKAFFSATFIVIGLAQLVFLAKYPLTVKKIEYLVTKS